MAHAAFIIVGCYSGFHFRIRVIDCLHAGPGDENRTVFVDVNGRIVSCFHRDLPFAFFFSPRPAGIVRHTEHGIGIELVGDHIIQVGVHIISAVRCKQADSRPGSSVL